MTNNDREFAPQDGSHRDHAGTGTSQHAGHEPNPLGAEHGHDQGGAMRGHQWMMMACCVPMLVIAIALVASGTAGVGVIALVIGCTLMMALMMRGMGGHGGGDGR